MKAIRMGGAKIAWVAGLVMLELMTGGSVAQAQSSSNVIQDSFTGTSAQLPWKAFNGACLTAGNNVAGSSGGFIPSCAAIQPAGQYYNGQSLVGLGSSSADAAGSGALRLTNSFSQNGAIIDTQPYASNLGIQVTFTTYTYGGNSGGTAKDGADGIGFYLLGATSSNGVANTLSNAAAVPSIGSWGGSLGYSCSNTNSPYDGMAGAYMGLGIDEFGNFLNSPDNTSSGDQAGTSNGGNGQQYQPGRIGLRAYGNVNLAALQAYNPNATKTDVQNTCKNGGTYSWSTSTTQYNLSYTYKTGNNVVTPFLSVTTTTTTDNVSWTSATKNGKSTSTSSCPTQKGTTSSSTTTSGGPQTNNNGTTTNYSGALYQMSTSSQAPTATTTNSTLSASYSKSGLVCTGTQAQQVVVTTTETDYTFTAAGSTNATPSTSNTSGYTGTGQMYGLASDGSYYPITFSAQPTTVTNNFTQSFPDYAAIPGAFVNLDPSTPIAKETATQRGQAVPISYKLQITQAGLLSLWYSYNGGTYSPVLTGQDITQANAPIPSSFLFGFGGSTGGSSNVHEITCFQVTPAETSASSAGLNVQSGEVKTGTQVYLASYHTNNWWGQLTAQNLVINNGIVTISSTANWDASCVLTGGTCLATNGTNTAQTASNRVLLSWQDSTVAKSTSNTGIQLTWANLTSTEQGWLNDDGNGQNRLAYLTGDRSNEVPSKNATSTQIFRDRNSVLSDIIDSSPTWVGPPSAPYSDTWGDKLYPTQVMPENSSTGVKYSAFVKNSGTRLNVVYDGANDGFMHGFRTGSYDSSGNYVSNTTTPNDGQEVLAYMPQAVLKSIHNTSTATLDYSSPKYAHAYYLDSTPGTGDLYYNGAWHTWLVSGLGPGGSAIFALDITDPTQFTNANAASIVIGEWSGATLSCSGNTTCGSNLGQTYGTPQIRRLHNGEWGVIFGNGFKSSTGDAGIFVMTFTNKGVLDTVYYLSTGVGSSSNPNGIAYVTPVDLDGDHITDLVYAGDVYGNVWRFDLTDATATNWAVSKYGNTSATPLFTTQTTTTKAVTSGGSTTTTSSSSSLSLSAQPGTVVGSNTVTSGSTTTTTTITNQPITTQLTVVSVSPSATGQPRVLVEFGTGSVIPQSTTSDIQYSPGQQALYGVWDWYLGQSGTAGAQYATLIGNSSQPTTTIAFSQLQQQSVTGTFSAAQSGIGQGARTISNNTICFVGTTCTSVNAQGKVTSAAGTMLGWYMNLPGYNGVSGVGGNNQTEQVIYSPIETDGSFIVNTVVPANNSPLTCTVQSAQGWTMALNPASGGAFQNSFFADANGNFVNINGAPISGIALNATGSPSVVTANKLPYLVTQTVSGAGAVNQINPPGSLYNKRLTWLQVH